MTSVGLKLNSLSILWSGAIIMASLIQSGLKLSFIIAKYAAKYALKKYSEGKTSQSNVKNKSEIKSENSSSVDKEISSNENFDKFVQDYMQKYYTPQKSSTNNTKQEEDFNPNEFTPSTTDNLNETDLTEDQQQEIENLKNQHIEQEESLQKIHEQEMQNFEEQWAIDAPARQQDLSDMMQPKPGQSKEELEKELQKLEDALKNQVKQDRLAQQDRELEELQTEQSQELENLKQEFNSVNNKNTANQQQLSNQTPNPEIGSQAAANNAAAESGSSSAAEMATTGAEAAEGSEAAEAAAVLLL